MMKRLAVLAAVVLLGFQLSAQTITIDNANFPAGPYGAGGGITVPIRISGCFAQANTFQLELSDAAGNFPGTVIGTYNSFFTPFVNGVIPAATAPGANYRVRVVSTAPAGVIATSNTFSVVATASNPVANPITAPSGTITGNDTTFGRCLFTVANANISLGFTVPGGTTLLGQVIDSLGNSVAATVTASAIQFTMVQGNYYTVLATIRNADNSVSVKSFLVLASTSNLSLQTAGSNEICLPDLKTYTINTTAVGGIRNNYPGTTYTIDWGDGNSTTFTHCELMNLNGSVSHLYTATSCGRPPITDITPNQYNAFRVNVTAQHQFCSNSFTPISSFAKVWERPEANFDNPEYGCINTPITFTNTSQVGLSATNNAVNCTNNAQYEWYVDGVFVSSAVNLVHSFSTPGNHTVQLVALNDPCSDDTTMIICIEPTPVPDFTMNGLNTISGCAPLTVTLANLTNANICREFTWSWQVFRLPSMALATPGVHYNITPSDTSANPVIEFLLPGEYVVRLTVGNSCGTFVRDRTVTLLLDADVNLPPNQQYCGLQTINFGTTPGHVVTYNVNSGTLSYNWNITPATYTFVGGSNANSSYPQVQFNAYGTYTIQVTFTNDCGTDQATQQIIFYEPATVNAGPDQAVCFPTNSVNLNGSSGGPAGYTASWSIRPGFGTGTISNVNIPNPTYTFSAGDKASGNVQLIYTATPPGGSACPPVRDTVVITIHPDNSVTSAATATICSGSSLGYTITASQPSSTFSWTSSVISGTATGNTAAGTGASINDALTNTSATTDAVVRYVITPTANGCTGNVFNLDVTVKPIPDFTPAPSATTLCSGEQLTINLTSGLAGAQYSWTSAISGGTLSGNTNQASPTATTSIVNTLTNTGTTDVTLTYTIRVYNPGSPVCPGETEQVIVTIRPPVNASASSNSPVCAGQAINLTGGSTTAGATFAWTGPNGFNSNLQSPSIASAIPAHAGVYTLITTANGCPSPAANVTVVVNPAPVIGSATGNNPTACASATGSISLDGLQNNTTYTVNYLLNGAPAAPISLTTNGSGVLVIPNLTSGIYSDITVTLSGCISNAMGPVTLSDPSAPNTPAASSNSPICSGNTLTLNASTTSPGVATWAWTGPNGFSSNQQNPTIPNASAAATGTYNVTVTIAGCTSAAGNVSVVVNQTPVLPVVGSNSPVCTGGTLNLSANSSTAGASYAWTGPNGFSSALQNPSIPNVTTAEAGVYSVIATLGTCSAASASTTVVVNPTPNIGGASATNPTNCASATGSISLTGLQNNTSYTVNYTFNGNPATPATISSDGTGTLVIPGLVAGTYANISVTLNGCPSNSVGPFTLSDPTPPATPVAGSNAPICSGNTLNLNASTSSAGTATWAWTGPNGFTSNQQNPSITNATVAATGTYTVTVTINGCTSAAGTVNATVNPTPVTPTAGSNSPVCTGSDINLNATTSTAGVSWNWSGPNGFASTLQNPTINAASAAANGVYSVTATLGSCTSAPGTVNVVVNATPNITGSSSSNPTNCASATGSITLNGLAASTTYTVNYTQGATPQTTTLISDASGNLVIPNLPAGNYSNVSVVLGTCPSNTVGPFTLVDPTPPATPVAASNGPVCSGNTLNLSATTTSGGTATWAWSGPNGFSSNLQNSSITNVPMAAAGVYTVTVTINSCTSAAGTVNVVVNETPATPVVTSNSPVCVDSTIQLNASTAFAGAVSWSWTGPNGFTSISQNPAIPNATLAAAGVYQVIATSTVNNCPSVAGTTTVVVNPTPVISSASFTNPTACLSSTGTIVLNGLAASTAYTVQYTRNGNPVSTTITTDAGGVLTIGNLSAALYDNIRVATLAGCRSTTAGPFTLTDPNPPAAPTAGSNSPICTGETLQLNASTTTPGAIVYTWTGPGGFNSNLQNPSILNATPANSGTYFVTATLNNCASPQTSVLVDVTTLPAAPTVTSPVNYCINQPAVPLTATPAPGNTLRWYTTSTGGTGSATAPTPSTTTAGVTAWYVSQVTPLGCEGTRAMIEVVVNPDALAVFTYTPMRSCAPFQINSTVIQTVQHPTRNSVYEWYANGVLIGSGTNFPGYTINNAGDSILIKLKTLSPFGCNADSTEQWFYTYATPVTDFTASDTVGCGPLSVTFTNTTPLMGQFTYNWNFGNGQTSTAANPGTIVFPPNPTTGDTIYQVSLTAFTQCDTITKTVGIRVKSRPQAIITPDKTYGCSPMTVVFNNISLGANMSFEWNFGDGSPSVFTNNTLPVQHTYNTGQQDTFYVRLIATNDCGSDTGYYNIVVAASTIDLDVAINGNVTTGCAPHTVQFFNHSSGATNFVWDFGDGNLRSTTANIDTVTHTYLTVGTFNVFIRASNGCTDTSLTETISVFAKPLVNFTVVPTSVCVGDTLQFTNQSDTITGLLWNFDDGVTSQLTNPVHAYSTPGTYNVKLIGIRQYAPGNACTDSIVRQVTVVASLPGSFRMSDSVSTCVPFTVTFTSESTPSALTTWDFGDGAVDTGDVVTHTFNQGGIFNVTMNARDLNGCTYTATRQVTAHGPTGTFFYDNGYICGNRPVRFEANTSGADSIRWDFGDGTIITTTAHIVFHVYDQPGVYIPSIRLLSGPGAICSRLVPGTDTIRVEYVSAGFTSMEVRSCGSTAVSFTDTSRAYFGVVGWNWNFGDGGTSSVQHPVHHYTTTNNWPVRLIATSASGCADTTTVTLFVKVDATPQASIVNDPQGCVNQPVTYNSVVISSDAVTYYSWTFSNLATGNTATVLNNYAAPGVYTAQLIAGTSFGCYDTATSTITINPSPMVHTNPDMVICRGDSAHLNATGGLTYTWAPFAGLSCNTCPNPVVSPATTTQYVVTGYNGFGCAARDTILITVPQPIDVTASADMVMCVGQSRQLVANGATTYLWSPAATLSNANIPNPVATPTTTTIYRVIGFDAYNCFQDTAFVTVGVGNYPQVRLGRDTVLATGTILNLGPTVTNGPITQWSWSPSTDLSCDDCPAPLATVKKDICYNVTATNAFGCSGSDTLCIRVFCESSQVFVPNAFTPDGDGINDKLVVRAKGVKLVKMFRIFNRWGQLVFEKSSFAPNADSHGWDGTVKGLAAPPDVYVYTCEVICEDDTPYTYKGNVAILK